MKVTITARKFKAHDTLRDYVAGEVEKLEKFYDEIMSADVILSYQNVNNSVKTAEIVVQIPGQTLTAKENADDFKKSVTIAVEKLLKQIDKVKTKKAVRS